MLAIFELILTRIIIVVLDKVILERNNLPAVAKTCKYL